MEDGSREERIAVRIIITIQDIIQDTIQDAMDQLNFLLFLQEQQELRIIMAFLDTKQEEKIRAFAAMPSEKQWEQGFRPAWILEIKDPPSILKH